MFDFLLSPWTCIGVLAGALAAKLIHWLVPSTDLVQVAAWLIGIGLVVGIAVELMSERRR